MQQLSILRKSKGLTQKEIAEHIGVSRQAYANYESGNREPDFKTLLKLAEYLDVSTDYLLGREDQRSVDLSGLTAAEATLICDLVASMTAKNKRMEDYL